MEDILVFKNYLQNNELDKALLLTDFILDDEKPEFSKQKNLILFIFSILDNNLSREDVVKAYTTSSFDVTLNPNDQFRNSIIGLILNQQYSKALRLLKTLIEKEKDKSRYVPRFDLVLYELLHALLRKRDREEKLLESLYQEGKYEEMLLYLDNEASYHRLSRTNTIIRKLLRVYLNILKTEEVPLVLPKCNVIDNFNAYFEVNDYANAYRVLCQNAALTRKEFPKFVYLDLLNKINTMIMEINQKSKRSESPQIEVTTTFDSKTFGNYVLTLDSQIARDGLVILEPALKNINKKRKEMVSRFKGLSSFIIGDNLENLVIINSDQEVKGMELISQMRSFYNEGDYASTTIVGRKIVNGGRPTVKDLLIMAMSYLKSANYDLGILYLKCAIGLGKKIDKDKKDKGWNYWDLENILEFFEEEAKRCRETSKINNPQLT